MDASDSVLPASRQPMPVDPKVQAEQDRLRKEQDRARKEQERRRQRSADEIEADLAHRTERLSENIDLLFTKAKPGNLARSGVASVRSSLTGADRKVRPEVIGAAVGALVAVGVLVWMSRRRR